MSLALQELTLVIGVPRLSCVNHLPHVHNADRFSCAGLVSHIMRPSQASRIAHVNCLACYQWFM